MTIIAHTSDEIKASLIAASQMADSFSYTHFNGGATHAVDGQRITGTWADYASRIAGIVATPWTRKAAEALLSHAHETNAAPYIGAANRAKGRLPVDVLATLTEGRRTDAAVETIAGLFVDIDEDVTEAKARALHEFLVAADINHVLHESCTSRLKIPGGYKGMRVHCRIQLKPVSMPSAQSTPRKKVQTWWKGEGDVHGIHGRAVRALLGVIGVQHDVAQKVDLSVDDLCQPTYCPYVPLASEPSTPRLCLSHTTGRELDVEAFLRLLGEGLPMPLPDDRGTVASPLRAAAKATFELSEETAEDTTDAPVPSPGDGEGDGETVGHTNGSLLWQAFDLTKTRRRKVAGHDTKWMVLCPWRHEHSRGDEQRERDLLHSSTTFWTDGERLRGGFCCKHQHSDGPSPGVAKTTADVLRWARVDKRVALDDRPSFGGEVRALKAVEAVEGAPVVAAADAQAVEVLEPHDFEKERCQAIGIAIDEMNENNAVVKIAGKVRFLNTEDDTLSDEKSLYTWYCNKPLQIQNADGEIESINRAALWVNSQRRREYSKVEFRPDLSREEAGRRGIYNWWPGFNLRHDADGGSCDLLLEHIRDNICSGDEDLYYYVIAWFARMLQRPDDRVGVALVLLSDEEGTGKNTLFEAVGHLLGSAYRQFTNSKHIVGNFNDHLERTIFLHSAEAVWAGNKSDESIQKALITDPTLTVERKGWPVYEAKNYIHLGITSNSSWAVPAGADTRRYAVIEVSAARKQDRKYFGAIKAQLADGGYEAFFDYLMAFDLDSVDLNRIPNTMALQKQKLASMPPIDAFFMEACSHGEIPGRDYVSWPDDEWKHVTRSSLLTAMQKFCQQQHKMPPNAVSFGIQIGKFGVKATKRGEYILPPLDDIRAVLEQRYGMKSAGLREERKVTAPPMAAPAEPVETPTAWE